MKNEKVICDLVNDIPYHMAKKDNEYICCDGRECIYKILTTNHRMICEYTKYISESEKNLLEKKFEYKLHSNK